MKAKMIPFGWDSLNEQYSNLIKKLILIWLFMFILLIAYFFTQSIIVPILLSFCLPIIWHTSKQLEKIDKELEKIMQGENK